jgi:tripartite-type tricarboxylate transporter receptor subunit TctC
MMVTGAAKARFLAGICTMFLVLTAVVGAAQSVDGHYPVKPIRLIVPQSPSGTVDMLACMIGQKLAEALRRQVVIDNRGGASGAIGSDLVARLLPTAIRS